MRKNDIERWLPLSIGEAEIRGWDEFDVILFTGDAYVDHPSFSAAVIGRVLESEGIRIGIVPQPNWQDDLRDFKKLGKPKLFFGVSAGNMDSMVNHYTAFKRLRSDDAYTPGGRSGARPDHPTIVYTKILKKLYPDVPVVIGGVEASMRRLAHYDYWSNRVEPPILISSDADMLVYGMGEQPVRELCTLLLKGIPFSSLTTVPQTAVCQDISKKVPQSRGWITKYLPSYEEVRSDKQKFAEAFVIFEKESNKIDAARLVQRAGNINVIINPPSGVMTTEEADKGFDLPYTRLPHPKYNRKPPIPAYEMIKYSVNIHRGCFGGCSFCAIAAHQGKHIVSRSEESVLREVDLIGKMPGFKGVISDIGGPSANMYRMNGVDLNRCATCSRPSCIWPSVCSNLDVSHKPILNLYRRIRKVEGVKRFFIGSGIRYDLLLRSFNRRAGKPEDQYLEEVIRHHVSGRFKVAPEHTEIDVVNAMRKTSFDYFKELAGKFRAITARYRLRYELVPYFISSHPGCTVEHMAKLALETKRMGLLLVQVQDFTPTPMTLSTTIYYTGYNPYSGKKVPVARDEKEKRRQNRFFFWYKKENARELRNELSRSGLQDISRELFSR